MIPGYHDPGNTARAISVDESSDKYSEIDESDPQSDSSKSRSEVKGKAANVSQPAEDGLPTVVHQQSPLSTPDQEPSNTDSAHVSLGSRRKASPAEVLPAKTPRLANSESANQWERRKKPFAKPIFIRDQLAHRSPRSDDCRNHVALQTQPWIAGSEGVRASNDSMMYNGEIRECNYPEYMDVSFPDSQLAGGAPSGDYHARVPYGQYEEEHGCYPMIDLPQGQDAQHPNPGLLNGRRELSNYRTPYITEGSASPLGTRESSSSSSRKVKPQRTKEDARDDRFDATIALGKRRREVVPRPKHLAEILEKPHSCATLDLCDFGVKRMCRNLNARCIITLVDALTPRNISNIVGHLLQRHYGTRRAARILTLVAESIAMEQWLIETQEFTSLIIIVRLAGYSHSGNAASRKARSR